MCCVVPACTALPALQKYTAMLNIEQMWFEGDPALSQAKACESAAGKALSSLVSVHEVTCNITCKSSNE